MLSELGRIIVGEWLSSPVWSAYICHAMGKPLVYSWIRVTNVVGSGFMSAVRSFSSSELNSFGPLDGSMGDSLS